MAFLRSEDAHKARWFSRRHEDSEAHSKAKEAYEKRAEGRPRQTFDEATSSWVKA